MSTPKPGTVTLSALSALVGVVVSAVGGSIYVSDAIAGEGRKAREEAVRIVEVQKLHASEIYARREDLRVLEVKLDTMLELQRKLWDRIAASERRRHEER